MDQAINLVRPIADALLRGDVEGALALAPESGCAPDDLLRVLTQHPIALRPLSELDYQRADVVRLDERLAGARGFDVRLDLPAKERGYGDLTLVLIVIERDGAWRVGIADLLTP